MDEIAPPSGNGSVRSVHRALAALEFLVGAAPHAVRVTDVAVHLQVTPATASRLLATLVERGYASRTFERRFTVGPASLTLATRWISRLRTAAAAPMGRVASATGETVMLSQLLGSVEVPIAWQASPDRSPERADKIEKVPPPYPLWATASGRAMLGELPPARRERLLPPEPYPQFTARTATTRSELGDLIRGGAKSRLHFDHGEVDVDLWCGAIALGSCEGDEILALAVVALGEPGAAQRARIHGALRREATLLGGSLMSTA